MKFPVLFPDIRKALLLPLLPALHYFLVNLEVLPVITAHDHMHHIALVRRQPFSDCIHGDLRRLFLGIAVNSSGDVREYDAVRPLRPGKIERLDVTGREEFRIILIPVIDGPDSMDHIFGGKVVGPGDLGLARMTAVQRSALFEKSRSCRPVDRTVYSSSAQQ